MNKISFVIAPVPFEFLRIGTHYTDIENFDFASNFIPGLQPTSSTINGDRHSLTEYID